MREEIEARKTAWGLGVIFFFIMVDGCMESKVINWKWLLGFLVGAGLCAWQFLRLCKLQGKEE